MKNFILRTIAFLFAGILCVVMLFYTLIKTDKICFLTNSISCNAKISFLKKNAIKLSQSHLFVVGSSMALNNVDAVKIQNYMKEPVLNLASWGAKLGDFLSFEFLSNKENIIIINLSPSEINIPVSDIEKYIGYPLDDTYELWNIVQRLKEYKAASNTIKYYKQYQSPVSKYHYQNLNFDETGSAVLEKENFNIDKKRFNERQLPRLDTAGINLFIRQLRAWDSVKAVYIFVTPPQIIHEE